MHEELNRAKEAVKNNWKPFTVGVIITTGIFVVTRKVSFRYMHISGTNSVINRATMKNGSLYNVYNIYNAGSKNHGPSWMVTCVETGKSFASQNLAARRMGLSKEHISAHLNGSRNHVNGYHFERIGIAA